MQTFRTPHLYLCKQIKRQTIMSKKQNPKRKAQLKPETESTIECKGKNGIIQISSNVGKAPETAGDAG